MGPASVTEASVIPTAESAGRSDYRRAMTVIAISLICFVASAPFAKTPLERFVPFIALYESALIFNDVVTAMLLFGVYKVFRSRAYVWLAAGYSFTAGMALAHALTFPGLFSPTGLLGAGEQTTAWLYMFWHAGFPIAVLAYAVAKGRPETHDDFRSSRNPVAAALLLTIAAVVILTFTATRLEAYLPAIMRGDEYTGEMPLVVRTVWGLSLAALAFLIVRRPHTVLDVWLIVVLCAWLFDIALAAVINHGRYDFGFYAGRIYGLLAVSFVLFVLLSENTKLQARLLRMHQQAAAANRAKDLFLAMVGHELRNPITSLKAAAHMVGRLTEANPRLVEANRLIDRQLAHLSRLVEDLVDAGRAAQGKLSIAKAPLDLAELVQEVVAQYRASGRLQEHRLTVRADTAPVHGDRQRLEQVIMNLVNNALKYTPSYRGIEIAVYPEGHEAVLSICDEGIGMKPEVAARSFDWFYQANDSLDRAQGGLGVGLALVKSLVDLHGGLVQVTAGEGQGSCFTVRLPLGERREEAAATPEIAKGVRDREDTGVRRGGRS